MNKDEPGFHNYDYPYIDTLKNIHMAFPLHHLAVVTGKVSGALSVSRGITDAMPLLHGPVGCSFQRKNNPFMLSSPFYDTPCTNMNDVDVVYGAEQKLTDGIIETYERYSPNLILVITTCSSDLIGDDIPGSIERAKEKVDCAVVYSNGDNVGKTAPIGMQDALYSIADQYICHEQVEKNPGSVNLINSPDSPDAMKFYEMASLLREMGIKINKMCFENITTRDMAELAAADLNITGFRMSFAEYLEKKNISGNCNLTGWDRYHKSRNPEHISPHGIAGSSRILMEIAERLGFEGEAESVIKKHKADTEGILETHQNALNGVKVAVPVGFSLNLLKDTGVEVTSIIHRTQTLTYNATEKAITEIQKAHQKQAELYGFQAEILVNPTPEEEIVVYKKQGVDLVLAPAKLAHFYHHEGMQTVDVFGFAQRKLNVGFQSSVELALLFRHALGKFSRRSPLLSMVDFDDGIANLTPDWAKKALSFHHLRSKNFNKENVNQFHGVAGVSFS